MDDKTKNFLDEARAIARDKDAAPPDVERKTAALIERNFPRKEFRDGECILMHEFQSRFRKAFCRGIEPHFAQWPVRVHVDQRDNISLTLGKTLEQIKAELELGEGEAG